MFQDQMSVNLSYCGKYSLLRKLNIIIYIFQDNFSSMIIPRKLHLQTIENLLADSPVVALLGAKQVGKTTLATEVAKNWDGQVHTFDMESYKDRQSLGDPLLVLSQLQGLVVMDEIQHLPEVFPTLRVLADRPGRPATFLVISSASQMLLRQNSESLAGRIAFHELTGFSVSEISSEQAGKLWMRGGFPSSLLAKSNERSNQWRRDFIRTFLAMEIHQFGLRIDHRLIEQFLYMLVHHHGQTLNEAELAKALGVARPTVRKYLNLLEATFMVRILKPWSGNLKKRQVKSPKIYIRDSGVLHYLMGVATQRELHRHPKIWASWEGFIIENIIQILGKDELHCYFWATHGGAEIDFVVIEKGSLRGFEIKRTSSPKITPSMRIAVEDLNLSQLDVIHAGARTFQLDERIRAVAADRLLEDI